MQSDGFVSVSSLVQDLAHICQKALTGCLYFVSSDNHVGKIVLKQGQIVVVRYYLDTDKAAISLIRQLDQVKYHFSNREIFKVLRSESLPENKVILGLLGLEDSSNSAKSSQTKSLPTYGENGVAFQDLSDSTKAKLEELLIGYLGPIASILCHTAFNASDDLATVITQLAEHISDPKEAQTFLQAAKDL